MSLSSKDCNRAIDEGKVKINGRIERFGSFKVKANSQIEIEVSPQASDKQHPVMDEKNIIFQNNKIFACNKPIGIPSQKTRDPKRASVESLMLAYWDKEHNEKATLLHRLDRDTSGVLLFSRKQEYAKEYFDLFKSREVQKTYLAICQGSLGKEKGEWRQYIDRKKKVGGQWQYGIVPKGGQTAIAEYRVLGSAGGYSLWQLKPKTGRTHQLRVQCTHAGFPIVGDPLYHPQNRHSSETFGHHFLHAWKLELPNIPSIKAELSPEFDELLDKFKLKKFLEI